MSQQASYFMANTNNQTNLIMGIPDGYVVTGVKIALLTQFVVPGSVSFTISVGLNDNAHSEFYASNFELTGIASPTTLQVTHSNLPGPGTASVERAHDIIAYFTANGLSYLSHITQGEVEVTILYRLV